ncbi:MAG: Ig-like domain-containing protein [Chloroflexi bacterium]|nr:Ig-like domain-containing protein [Chloroflexota bacterium]
MKLAAPAPRIARPPSPGGLKRHAGWYLALALVLTALAWVFFVPPVVARLRVAREERSPRRAKRRQRAQSSGRLAHRARDFAAALRSTTSTTALILSLVLFSMGRLVGGTVAYFTNTESLGSNTVSTAAQFAPSGLATSVNLTTVSLTWTGPGWTVSGYNVYRSTTSGSGYVQTNASLVTATSYDDVSLGPDTYYYVVRLVSTTGVESPINSNEASAVVTGAGSPPAGLTATAGVGPKIDLSWTSVSGMAGYNVYRSLTSGSGYNLLATVDGESTITYSDTVVSDSLTYYYVVKSRAGSGILSDDSNEASATADGTSPSVSSVTPAGGVTNISVNANVVLTYTEAMNQTNTNSAFSLTDGITTWVCTTDGSCTWSTDGKTFTFDKSADLAASTTYTVAVSTTAKDGAGNALSSAHSSTFTTKASTTPDTTVPTITTLSPADGATNIPTNTNITVTFSEAMDTGSTQAAFCLYPTASTCGADSVSGSFTWSNVNSTLTLDVTGLLSSTNYTLRITGGAGGAADVSGNVLVSTSTTSFTTASGTGPTISLTSPTDGQTLVDRNDNIVITFSLVMNTGSVQTAFCHFLDEPAGTGSCGSTSVAGVFTWSNSDKTVTFNPNSNMNALSQYRVTLGTSATSATGISLATALDMTFTTSSNSPARDILSPTEVMPGATAVFAGSSFPSTTRKVELRWDATDGTLIGDTGACKSTTGLLTSWAVTATIPFAATAGGHTVYAIGYRNTNCPNVGTTTSGGISVVYPDDLTITSQDFVNSAGDITGSASTNAKLNPSGCGSTTVACPEGKKGLVTTTVKKDASAVGEVTMTSVTQSDNTSEPATVSGTYAGSALSKAFTVKVVTTTGSESASQQVITGVQVSTDGGATYGSTIAVSGATAVSIGDGLSIAFGVTGTTTNANDLYRFIAGYANAGIVFSMTSNPASCGGGSLSQTGTTAAPLTSAATTGQVSTTLTACTASFTDAVVTARTGNGISKFVRFTDPPPPPGDFELIPGSIRINWRPSTHPLVAGYRIYLGTRSGQYEREFDAGNTTTYRVTDVEYGRPYYVVIRSYSSMGDLGDPTAEKSITLAPPTPTPTPCSNPAPAMTATPVGATPVPTTAAAPATATPTLATTPAPCASVTATTTATVTSSATATTTATTTAGPTGVTITTTPAPTEGVTSTTTPAPTGGVTLTTTPGPTQAGSPTATETATVTATPPDAPPSTATALPTPTFTALPTNTPVPTSTPLPSPTEAPVPSPTETPTPAPTATVTPPASPVPTQSSTLTPTPTQTRTPVPMPTNTPAPTATPP